MVDEAPQGLGVLSDPVLFPLLVRVVEEGAEQAGVQVVQHKGQKVLVEFK